MYRYFISFLYGNNVFENTQIDLTERISSIEDIRKIEKDISKDYFNARVRVFDFSILHVE